MSTHFILYFERKNLAKLLTYLLCCLDFKFWYPFFVFIKLFLTLNLCLLGNIGITLVLMKLSIFNAHFTHLNHYDDHGSQ